MRQVALNYQNNLGRVAYASVGTAVIFSIWSSPLVMATWAVIGIVTSVIGDRATARLLAVPSPGVDVRQWWMSLVVPRVAFLVNWTALLYVGWDRDRPATYIFAYLFVMATLAQNAVTSSVYTPMLLAELAPKILGSIVFGGYWWASLDQSTDVIFGSTIPMTLFYTVFVLRMAADLRKANLAQVEISAQLLEAWVQANVALRERDGIMAIVAHEIRNPLTAIAGYVEVLRGMDHPEDIASSLDRLGRATQVLLRITRGLLSEADDLDARPSASLEEVDPKEVTATVVEMLAPGAGESGLALIFECGDVPSGFVTDTRRLQQVLINLLVNAIRYTEHGHVCLSLDRSVGVEADVVALRWEVTDTGPGLPDDTERLFERFQRGQAGGEGTGLGLAVASEAISALGGRLGSGEAPTGGASLWFELAESRPPSRL